MNTVQIAHCLETDVYMKKLCLGVFAANKIPKITKFPSCIIANTDIHTKSGTHWVAFYFDDYGSCEFFDTYGRQPRNKYFQKLKPEVWSEKQVQALQSSVCGQHCVHFLYERCRGFSFDEILQLYGTNLNANDSCVSQFVNDVFDLTNLPSVMGHTNQYCVECCLKNL